MPNPTPISGERRHEAGAALLIAMLLLAMLGVIGLASMETVTRDRQVAGFQNRGRAALYAAEAGVAHATGIIRQNAQVLAPGGEGALESFDPAFPGKGATAVASLGADFPAPGSPSYRMDPDALGSHQSDRAGAGRPLHGPRRSVPRLDHEHDGRERDLGGSALGHPRGRLGPRRRQRGDPGHGRELPPVQLRRDAIGAAQDARQQGEDRCDAPPRPIAGTAFRNLAAALLRDPGVVARGERR